MSQPLTFRPRKKGKPKPVSPKPRLPQEWLTIKLEFPSLGHFYEYSASWVSRTRAISYVWKKAKKKFKASRETDVAVVTVRKGEKPLDAQDVEKYNIVVFG